MSTEVETLKQELAKEKQLANFYHHLYEREHVKNEELHAALVDLRKKCERWYNSTEMEEEMLVNKLITQLDELKSLKETTPTRMKSASFDSFDHSSLGGLYQRKVMTLQHEMAEKEKNIEALQEQLKNMKQNSHNGKDFAHHGLSTIEE